MLAFKLAVTSCRLQAFDSLLLRPWFCSTSGRKLRPLLVRETFSGLGTSESLSFSYCQVCSDLDPPQRRLCPVVLRPPHCAGLATTHRNDRSGRSPHLGCWRNAFMARIATC